MQSTSKIEKNARERLKYFFKEPLRNRLELHNFLNYELSEIGEFVVFGGLIRDIALGSIRNFYSDIDIVIAPSNDNEFEKLIGKKKNSRKNSFGGYKLSLENWDVDIWKLHDTWSFRNNFADFQPSFELLPWTTFFNLDGICFNPLSNDLFKIDSYFDDVRNKILRINSVENCLDYDFILRKSLKMIDTFGFIPHIELIIFLEGFLELQDHKERYSAHVRDLKKRIIDHIGNYPLEPFFSEHQLYFNFKT